MGGTHAALGFVRSGRGSVFVVLSALGLLSGGGWVSLAVRCLVFGELVVVGRCLRRARAALIWGAGGVGGGVAVAASSVVVTAWMYRSRRLEGPNVSRSCSSSARRRALRS